MADRRAFRPGQLPSVYVRGRERERERERERSGDGGGGGGYDDGLGFDGCHGHGLRDLGFNRETFRAIIRNQQQEKRGCERAGRSCN